MDFVVKLLCTVRKLHVVKERNKRLTLLRFSCMIAALHKIGPLKSLYVCASQMAIHQITCNPWVICRDHHVMLIFVWHYFHRSERIVFFFWQTYFFMNFLMAVWLSSSDFACYPSLQVSVHKYDENLSIYNLLGPQKFISLEQVTIWRLSFAYEVGKLYDY